MTPVSKPTNVSSPACQTGSTLMLPFERDLTCSMNASTYGSLGRSCASATAKRSVIGLSWASIAVGADAGIDVGGTCDAQAVSTHTATTINRWNKRCVDMVVSFLDCFGN